MRRLTPPQWILVAGLGLGAVLRLHAAFTDHGLYWPDEIYQSLEPAHRLIWGYGLVAWEFIDGARNWALPGFVAFWFMLAKAFGLDTPPQYLGLIRIVFVALSVGSAWGVYRLAKSFGADEWPAAAAAAALMLCAPSIYFAHRAMAENASALPVVLGLWLTLRPDALPKEHRWGAALLAVAVLLRLQCGLFCVGVLAILLIRRQRRPALEVFGVLCVGALAYGALDAFTWSTAPGAKAGGWFHSAVKYLQFNLIEGKASGWGTSPWHFYAHRLYTSMPGLCVALAAGLVLGVRKAASLVALGVLFVAAHSAIPHKELRFVLPALPVLFAAAAVGFSQWKGTLQRGAVVALLLAGAWSAYRHKELTFGDLGAYPERPTVSAWDDYGRVMRLMLEASKHEDLCGLRIDAAHLAWTGGSTYLHRNAPLFMPGTPTEWGGFNYAIVMPGSGATVVASDSGLDLVKIPVQCVDPVKAGYTWRLP